MDAFIVSEKVIRLDNVLIKMIKEVLKNFLTEEINTMIGEIQREEAEVEKIIVDNITEEIDTITITTKEEKVTLILNQEVCQEVHLLQKDNIVQK